MTTLREPPDDEGISTYDAVVAATHSQNAD